MSPRKYKSIDLHRLEQHSLGKCNICQEDLIKEDKPGTYYYNGNIAHIRDVKPGHRHDPQMNDAESDSFDNLLLICVSCHKKLTEVKLGRIIRLKSLMSIKKPQREDSKS